MWLVLWYALVALGLTLEILAVFYSFKAQWEQNQPKEDGYE